MKECEDKEKQLKADLEKASKDDDFALELRKRLGLTGKSEKKDSKDIDDTNGEKLSCS